MWYQKLLKISDNFVPVNLSWLSIFFFLFFNSLFIKNVWEISWIQGLHFSSSSEGFYDSRRRFYDGMYFNVLILVFHVFSRCFFNYIYSFSPHLHPFPFFLVPTSQLISLDLTPSSLRFCFEVKFSKHETKICHLF